MDENQVLDSTEFSWKELKRLIDLIPQTDPTTHAYGILLESIERYGAIMKFVDWFLSVKIQKPEPKLESSEDGIIQFPVSVSEEEKFEEPEPTPEPEPEEDETEYDPAVVKSLITKARAEKKIPSAKAWIQENWGVDGFSAIPASKYPQVMAKLKELGVS